MDASPYGFESFVMFDGWEFTTARRYAKRRAEIIEDLSIADCGLKKVPIAVPQHSIPGGRFRINNPQFTIRNPQSYVLPFRP